MKLVRYGEPGREKPGILDRNEKVRDLSGVISDIDRTLLADMSVLQSVDIDALPVVPVGVRIGPCYADVANFLCIGLNYVRHARESNMPLPGEPVLFMKHTSAIAGPYDPIVLPRGSEKSDWEAELGLVIGKTARNVSKDDALSYIAGYCAVNDVSERALQMATSQWIKGKSCDGFAPIGPWLVTPDEIPDPQNLHLWLKVNGNTMQDDNTSDMIFSVAEIISHLSSFMTLLPGDVLITGTPPGVGNGRTPPVYLRAGDVVEFGIDGLGVQRQTVREG